MFSSIHPPGAFVAWPLRDARQGWQRPPTRGGRCDGGVHDAPAGTRGAPGGADRLWSEMSGNAVESRRFTRDNWNYRAQKSVSRHVGTARVYHVVIRMWDHVRSESTASTAVVSEQGCVCRRRTGGVRCAHRGHCNKNVDFLLAITSRRASGTTPSNLGARPPPGLPPASA